MSNNSQVLAGYLNFLTRAIFAGRTFTRRIYAKFSSYTDGRGIKKQLKPHHHVRLDSELRFDCEVWLVFLENFTQATVCHPMVDFSGNAPTCLNFYSDTSAAEHLGFGAIYKNDWLFMQWEPQYIKNNSQSIEYLELLALMAAILTWGAKPELCNTRFQIFCDNMAVVNMVNNSSSSCSNCMYLLRLLVLNNLVYNRRAFVKHIKTRDNVLSDALKIS